MSNQPSPLRMPSQVKIPPSLVSPGVSHLANRTEKMIAQHCEFAARTGRVDPKDHDAMMVFFKVLVDQSLEYQVDALAGVLQATEVESYWRTTHWKAQDPNGGEEPLRVGAFVVATMDPELAEELQDLIECYMRDKCGHPEQQTTEGESQGDERPGLDPPATSPAEPLPEP